MTKDQMIDEIAKIQHFVRVNVYNNDIDKELYFDKIRKSYANIDTKEVSDNLEEVKYIAIGAIKSKSIEIIENKCHDKKSLAYEEYLNKCEVIEKEMNHDLMNNEVLTLTVDKLNDYITSR